MNVSMLPKLWRAYAWTRDTMASIHLGTFDGVLAPEQLHAACPTKRLVPRIRVGETVILGVFGTDVGTR
jgi:hypothetical protein